MFEEKRGIERVEYKEKRFEEDIEHFLFTSGGYIKGDMRTYDREKAIDMPKLMSSSKPLSQNNGKDTKNLQRRSRKETIQKIQRRSGNARPASCNKIRHQRSGVKLRVAYFRPESTLNPEVIQRYEKTSSPVQDSSSIPQIAKTL